MFLIQYYLSISNPSPFLCSIPKNEDIPRVENHFWYFLLLPYFFLEKLLRKTDWRIRIVWVNKALWSKGSHYITHLCLTFYITWDRSNYEDLTCWDMRRVVELTFASTLLLPYAKKYIILKRITRCHNMKPAPFTFQVHWPYLCWTKGYSCIPVS